MAHSVGKSSYGDLNGIVQFVSSLIVAAQVASLCYEFDTQFPGARARGDRLTVNEGIRSKRRMEILRAAWETYQRYGTPWAALAAALYFSTHRGEIGTALDFGITTKDGGNRAMTAAEAAWVHQHGPARGIVWTGRLFNPQESWHHNGGYAYTLPPIVGVNLPGEPFFDQHDDTTTQLRKALMAASDTLTVYQRIGTNGKDEDTYFVAGPGIFADLIRGSEVQELGKSIGVQFTGKELRSIFVRDGVKFVKCAAADFDQRRSMYASLSKIAQGKAA